jgi:hypothetical protein
MPRGLFLKMVYFFARRQFGKVMTPIAVFSARMPVGFRTPVGLDPEALAGRRPPGAG